MCPERIPPVARSYDPATKTWLIGVSASGILSELLAACFGYTRPLPAIAADQCSGTATLRADYVANSKSGTGWSSVWVDGGWNAAVRESELRKWFRQPSTGSTLFSALGIDETAGTDEIRKAYKRAARQWHPDICREPNAREMFERIKLAHDTLTDPGLRQKYVAGLAFERMATSGQTHQSASFIPILRCGMITAKVRREAGRTVIEEILSWEDITNEEGKRLISSWSGDSFTQFWV